MKKTMSLILILVTAITLVGCNSQGAKLLDFAEKENVMAFQAVTSVQVAEGVQTKVSPMIDTQTDMPTDDQIDAIEEVSPYIGMFENLLSQSDGFTHETTTSDIEGYTHMQVFSMPNQKGQFEDYVMYYNLVTMDDDNDDDDDDDNEVSFTFEGIIQYNDHTYDVYGKKKVEDDEFELEFITKIDDNNYVLTKYETESDELEFEYEVYENGKKISSFKLEIEDENDDNEIEIELEFTSEHQSGKFEFELENKDGKMLLKIEFETTIDGNYTKGKAYYNVTYDDAGNPQYEVIFTKHND